MTGSHRFVLVKGADPVLRADTTAAIVDDLLGGDDRSIALDDLEIPDRKRDDEDERADVDDSEDELDGAALGLAERIMVAISSPPFLTSRRVVVIRNANGLTKTQAEMIVERLNDPVPGVHVVLVQHGGKLATPLAKFVKDNKIAAVEPEAETIAASTEKKKGPDKRTVVDVELQRAIGAAGVKLDSGARGRIVGHLGDDAARVHELVALLATRFPLGSTVRADDIEPYLGEAGTTASSFDLTAAIENGDAATALEVLHRLMHATSAKHAKPQHPMQLMPLLANYYRALLRLDDPSVHTKEDAHAILGGNPWAAKYRFDAYRTVGSAGVAKAYQLLAQADLDLRGAGGATALDNETVMQLLVARLCALHQRKGSRGAKTPAAGGRGR